MCDQLSIALSFCFVVTEKLGANTHQKLFPRLWYAAISPLANCLRRDVAKSRNRNGSAECVNNVVVRKIPHACIVSILTQKKQAWYPKTSVRLLT